MDVRDPHTIPREPYRYGGSPGRRSQAYLTAGGQPGVRVSHQDAVPGGCGWGPPLAPSTLPTARRTGSEAAGQWLSVHTTGRVDVSGCLFPKDACLQGA